GKSGAGAALDCRRRGVDVRVLIGGEGGLARHHPPEAPPPPKEPPPPEKPPPDEPPPEKPPPPEEKPPPYQKPEPRRFRVPPTSRSGRKKPRNTSQQKMMPAKMRKA